MILITGGGYFAEELAGNIINQPASVQSEPVSVADKLKSAAVSARQIPEMIAIINHLQANPDLSRGQLSQLTGISDSGIKRRLEKLVQLGLLARVDPDKGGTWRVIR